MGLYIEDRGNGFPVVFLHAFPLDGRMWADSVDVLLKAGFRAITVDLPGFGKSDGLMEGIPETADKVIASLSPLKLGKYILCGLSMGGYVSFEIIRKTPGALHSAVLCDTTADADSEEKRTERFSAVTEIERAGTAEFMRRMADSFLSGHTLDNNSTFAAEFMEKLQEAKPEAVTAALRSMAGRKTSLDLLSSIDFPVLYIFGSEDPMLPAGKLMQENTANSTLRIIEKAGHFSNLESAAEFNDALTGFIAQLSFE